MRFGCRIYIASIDPDSPAASSRLQEGDTVLQLGDAGLQGLSLNRVGRLLKSSRHELRLLVEREGEEDSGESEKLLKVNNSQEEKPSNLAVKRKSTYMASLHRVCPSREVEASLRALTLHLDRVPGVASNPCNTWRPLQEAGQGGSKVPSNNYTKNMFSGLLNSKSSNL